MAKCIRKDDTILRVSNEEAARLVRHGWQYVAKRFWKAVGRKAN